MLFRSVDHVSTACKLYRHKSCVCMLRPIPPLRSGQNRFDFVASAGMGTHLIAACTARYQLIWCRTRCLRQPPFTPPLPHHCLCAAISVAAATVVNPRTCHRFHRHCTPDAIASTATESAAIAVVNFTSITSARHKSLPLSPTTHQTRLS